MYKPDITIITPSYNQGKYIRRTIDSVLKQNINNIEYLIFDGGSTDDTVDILKSYGDRVKWVSAKDKGQSDAVNKGLVNAASDVIGWLNSDDIYYEGALQTVIDIFRTNPEIKAVYGLADHIDENDQYLEDYYTEEWDYQRLQEVCYICQPTVFFKREIVDECGLLDERLNYCMDYEYWLRIGRHYPFQFINQKLAGSRLYCENKTLGNRVAVHQEIVIMQKNLLGRANPRWIYNLAHVLAEEKGLDRNHPGMRREFVIDVVKQSIFNFFKYNYCVPVKEIKTIAGWLKRAYDS